LIRHFNVDPTLVDECIDHFRADGRFAGLIRNIAGGERVDLQASQPHTLKTPSIEDESSVPPADPAADQQVRSVAFTPGVPAIAPDQTSVPTQRVFITHGRNQSVVGQVKELLQFGKFEPVVAEEHETPSVPVPDKVMDEMRSCFTGVIHIESEEELLDGQGNTHHRINENVLIEIGAALALYRRNVVLLVQHGLHLPSNLQGLYRCDYTGSKLDYEATMKLLKTFSQFK
jgi:predicted nucleotide-binding protein